MYIYHQEKLISSIMKKKKWIISAVILALIIISQFFQPKKNQSGFNQELDFFSFVNAPEKLKEKIIVSCYDCHSNNTNYPWYGRITPVSYWISFHVIKGKDELNFSEWAEVKLKRKKRKLRYICEEMQDRKMPLKSYILMHKEAACTQEEIDEICDWIETEVALIPDAPRKKSRIHKSKTKNNK